MRELLVIRHAIAHERDAATWPDDDLRPLTLAGRRKFRRVARYLSRNVPTPEEVLCSPLKRTRQTARILRRDAAFPKAKRCDFLRPEASVRMLIGELASRKAERLAIVGHEPVLSQLIAELLGAKGNAKAFRMKKGALVWLYFPRQIGAQNGRLVACVPPRLVRSRQ